MIASLAQEKGSIGAYALFDRQFYVELSMYRVGNGFFRFMNAGTSYQTGAQYLKGFNAYWRAYWTKDHGPNVWMIGHLACAPEFIRAAPLPGDQPTHLPIPALTRSISIWRRAQADAARVLYL
jgi:hypothetical protein